MSIVLSKGIRAVAIEADDASVICHAPIGLAINIVSMQEMNPPVISNYFDLLRKAPGSSTVFYCCNRIDKTLPDETRVRFDRGFCRCCPTRSAHDQ